jgi:hypothetical protein
MSEVAAEPILQENQNADTSSGPADTYVPVFKKDLQKRPVEHEDIEFANAKSFLSTKISKDSTSVYDHLTALVSRILETKPSNALDSFEIFSSDIKKSKFKVENQASGYSFKVHKKLIVIHLQTVPEPTVSSQLAQTHLEIFNHQKEDNNEAAEIPDIMDLKSLWDWAGVIFQTLFIR